MPTRKARKPSRLRLLPERWPWQTAEKKISESEKLDQFLTGASPKELLAIRSRKAAPRGKGRWREPAALALTFSLGAASSLLVVQAWPRGEQPSPAVAGPAAGKAESRALVMEGTQLLQAEDWSRAAAVFERAAKADPESGDSWPQTGP